MTDHIPGSVGEAFANLARNFERLNRSFALHTRYPAGDLHRNRLVWSGQYIKTTNRRNHE